MCSLMPVRKLMRHILALMEAGDGSRYVTGGWWSLDARRICQLLGQGLQRVQYGIDADGYMDYGQMSDLADEHKPADSGFLGVLRVVDWAMREIADNVGAYFLVDMAHIAGLSRPVFIRHPSHAHVVTTTTHKTLRGPRSGLILSVRMTKSSTRNSAVFPGMQGGPLMHATLQKLWHLKKRWNQNLGPTKS